MVVQKKGSGANKYKDKRYVALVTSSAKRR